MKYKIVNNILWLIFFGIVSIGVTFIFQTLVSMRLSYALTFIMLFIWAGFMVTHLKLQKIKALTRVHEFKSETLNTLLNISEIFLHMDENDDYYTLILNSAIKVIKKAVKGSFLELNPLTGRFEYKACVGYEFDTLRKVSFTLEETFLYKNAQGDYDRPVITKNIASFDNKKLDPLSVANILDAGGLDIQEAISAPIVQDGKIVGILNIDSVETDAFDTIDTSLLHFFASQIAVALKHKALVDETVSLSRFDKLTGAYHRNYFEKLFQAHRIQSLESMSSYALILCDVNDLKVINDNYGHSAGDKVLVGFSDKIRKHIRESDVFARIGGDEFVILLRDIDPEMVHVKMSSIFDDINDSTIDVDGHALTISFSYGIATSPEDSMVYDVLLKIADSRMYEFKENYKNNLLP